MTAIQKMKQKMKTPNQTLRRRFCGLIFIIPDGIREKIKSLTIFTLNNSRFQMNSGFLSAAIWSQKSHVRTLPKCYSMKNINTILTLASGGRSHIRGGVILAVVGGFGNALVRIA
ncbi:hypothetical protein KH388_23560 [Serratia rubidaea]|nr:hypothetical protein [Serratia rubidaea]